MDTAISLPPFKDELGRSCVPNVVNGAPVALPSSVNFPVTSARTGQLLYHGQTASVDVVNQAVDAAWSTFKTYRKTSIPERTSLLLKAGEIFVRRAEEARLRGSTETSCTEQWAHFNSIQTSTFCAEIASAIAEATRGEIPHSHFGHISLVVKEPRGPALIIPPWNAPLVLASRAVANALAAGCTVVLKASELCPYTHTLIMEVFHEAGFPPGAVNLIMADRAAAAQITEAVIAHDKLRIIEFIGSASVGRCIGQMASKHLKPMVMELGDQSPAIILEDADLRRAARVIAQGTTHHHGQVCFSTERILVHSHVKKEFTALLVEELSNMESQAAYAVTRSAAERAQETINAAVKDGAKFVYGSNELTSPGSLHPSILTEVSRKSKLSREEIFAPTAVISEISSDDEAVEEANSRDAGLSAAVWTRDYERAIRIARDLEFGMVQVNGSTIFAEPSGPVQGYKGSGWGSNNGRYGIENYLFNKAISLPALLPTGDSDSH